MDGADEPQPPVSNGPRLRDGRFGKGNTFGRSCSPYMRRLGKLRGKLLDCTTEEDIEQLIATLRRLSLEGDVAAIRLWLEYAVAKPPTSIELTDADGEPLGVRWARVEDAIIAALAPFGPAASFAVAAALREIVRDDGGTDEAGPPA